MWGEIHTVLPAQPGRPAARPRDLLAAPAMVSTRPRPISAPTAAQSMGINLRLVIQCAQRVRRIPSVRMARHFSAWWAMASTLQRPAASPARPHSIKTPLGTLAVYRVRRMHNVTEARSRATLALLKARRHAPRVLRVNLIPCPVRLPVTTAHRAPFSHRLHRALACNAVLVLINPCRDRAFVPHALQTLISRSQASGGV